MTDEQMSIFEEWWALDGRNLYAESRIDVLRIWSSGYDYGQQSERKRCAKLANCDNHKHSIDGCMGDDIEEAIMRGG